MQPLTITSDSVVNCSDNPDKRDYHGYKYCKGIKYFTNLNWDIIEADINRIETSKQQFLTIFHASSLQNWILMDFLQKFYGTKSLPLRLTGENGWPLLGGLTGKMANMYIEDVKTHGNPIDWMQYINTVQNYRESVLGMDRFEPNLSMSLSASLETSSIIEGESVGSFLSIKWNPFLVPQISDSFSWWRTYVNFFGEKKSSTIRIVSNKLLLFIYLMTGRMYEDAIEVTKGMDNFPPFVPSEEALEQLVNFEIKEAERCCRVLYRIRLSRYAVENWLYSSTPGGIPVLPDIEIVKEKFFDIIVAQQKRRLPKDYKRDLRAQQVRLIMSDITASGNYPEHCNVTLQGNKIFDGDNWHPLIYKEAKEHVDSILTLLVEDINK